MSVPTSDMSTKQIASYPEPMVLLRRCIAFALLGKIAAAGYEAWIKRALDIDVDDHEPAASFGPRGDGGELRVDNGQGDHFMVQFGPAGVLICGFAHEYPMSPFGGEEPFEVWPDMFEDLPAAMLGEIESWPYSEEITFCVWWTRETGWVRGVKHYDADPWYVPDPDGSGYLLEPIGCDPAATSAYWAHEYGEMLPHGIDAAIGAALRDEAELTDDLIASINTAADPAEIRGFAARIGYGDVRLP